MNPATLSIIDRSTTGPGNTILPIRLLDALHGESADIFGNVVQDQTPLSSSIVCMLDINVIISKQVTLHGCDDNYKYGHTVGVAKKNVKML